MSGFNVKGLSSQDILNLDYDVFISLDAKDLAKVTSRLVSSANKRIRRMEEKGLESPAYQNMKRSGGNFSVAGKDLNQLRSEYMRVKNFMNSRTSSLKGWSEVKRDTVRDLKAKGVEVDKKNLDTVLRAYEELRKMDPNIADKNFKYRYMGKIAEHIKAGVSIQDAVQKTMSKLDQIYEEQEMLTHEQGVSGFFEGGENL